MCSPVSGYRGEHSELGHQDRHRLLVPALRRATLAAGSLEGRQALATAHRRPRRDVRAVPTDRPSTAIPVADADQRRALHRHPSTCALVPSTVQSSIAFTSIAKGNVAGAIVSASFSNLIGVFVTPLLVVLLMNTTGQATVDFSSILDIVVQLLIPFIVGQLIRPLVIGWLQKYAEPTKYVDRGSILLVVFAAFSESMKEGIWSTITIWQIVILTIVCCLILALVLGVTTLAGRKLGFDLPDQIVIIFCGSKKSLATGLPMAAVLFAGQPVGLIVVAADDLPSDPTDRLCCDGATLRESGSGQRQLASNSPRVASTQPQPPCSSAQSMDSAWRTDAKSTQFTPVHSSDPSACRSKESWQ